MNKIQRIPPQRMRLVLRQRTRTRMMAHQKIVIASSFLFMLTLGFIIFINLTQTSDIFALANGDYRSKASGNWNSTSTWETYNGSSWVAASSTPSSADGVITIQSGHTVTITANVTVDQVVISAGGTVTNSSATLTVANGTGSDIDISGIFNLNTGGTVTISSSALITILNGGFYYYNGGTETTSAGWAVNNGGTYVHNVNGIDIPNGTWGATSTLKITGVVNTDPDVQGQTFGHVIYDCPNQTMNLDFKDKLQNIAGDFTVVNTGTGSIKFDRSSTNVTLYVSGNYYQTGGTLKMTNQGNWNVNVAGNFSLSGGTYIMAGTDGTPALTVSGNLTVSGGTLDMSQYTGNTGSKGIGTINLSGNFIQTSGALTETSTGTGNGVFNFAKSGTQTFSITGGSITNTINFNVNSGSILDAGTNIFTGDGTFTVASGGGIILGNANGITSSGASGNIQVAGTRTFSTGGNYTYSGTSAQNTGSGLPSQVNKFTLNNSSGLTLTNSVIVASTLTFTSGNLITNANVISVGTSQASSNTGTLIRTTGHVIGFIRRWISSSAVNDILFPVGTATYYEGMNASVTSVPSGGTLTASFTDANNSYYGMTLTDGSAYIGTVAPGYWTLTPGDGMSGGAFTIDFYANSLAPIMADVTKMHVIRKTLLADPWTVNGNHVPGTGTNANPIAHRSSVSIWGIYAIGSEHGFPLPVELTLFDVKPTGTTVNCTWQTASEINNDYFTVERSADGKNFIPLETILGAGNSNTTLNYSFKDTKPLNGINYYRLKQTDYDGKFTYSTIKSVSLTENTGGAISINSASPNPFKDNFSILYSVDDNSEIGISIMNSSGQIVFSQKQNAFKGTNRFDYNEGLQLPDGIYFAKLTMNNQVQIRKIVKN